MLHVRGTEDEKISVWTAETRKEIHYSDFYQNDFVWRSKA